MAFLAIYMTTVGIFTILLTAMGLDARHFRLPSPPWATWGRGLARSSGPAGNFANPPAGAKWVLALAMMLGRLELFTVLVLLRPEFWRG